MENFLLSQRFSFFVFYNMKKGGQLNAFYCNYQKYWHKGTAFFQENSLANQKA